MSLVDNKPTLIIVTVNLLTISCMLPSFLPSCVEYSTSITCSQPFFPLQPLFLEMYYMDLSMFIHHKFQFNSTSNRLGEPFMRSETSLCQACVDLFEGRQSTKHGFKMTKSLS